MTPEKAPYDEKFVDLLVKNGLKPKIARTLAYLTGKEEVKSIEIERDTGLRQPEVSIAIQRCWSFPISFRETVPIAFSITECSTGRSLRIPILRFCRSGLPTSTAPLIFIFVSMFWRIRYCTAIISPNAAKRD